MKEIRSLLVMAKETCVRQGVSLKGQAHGEIEETFKQLHGALIFFAENPDLFDACHSALLMMHFW